jgi:hypothetical protein
VSQVPRALDPPPLLEEELDALEPLDFELEPDELLDELELDERELPEDGLALELLVLLDELALELLVLLDELALELLVLPLELAPPVELALELDLDSELLEELELPGLTILAADDDPVDAPGRTRFVVARPRGTRRRSVWMGNSCALVGRGTGSASNDDATSQQHDTANECMHGLTSTSPVDTPRGSAAPIGRPPRHPLIDRVRGHRDAELQRREHRTVLQTARVPPHLQACDFPENYGTIVQDGFPDRTGSRLHGRGVALCGCCLLQTPGRHVAAAGHEPDGDRRIPGLSAPPARRLRANPFRPLPPTTSIRRRCPCLRPARPARWRSPGRLPSSAPTTSPAVPTTATSSTASAHSLARPTRTAVTTTRAGPAFAYGRLLTSAAAADSAFAYTKPGSGSRAMCSHQGRPDS